MPVMKPADWAGLPDEELLRLRVRDLGLTIAGTALEDSIHQLYDELKQKNVSFRPTCYLADEWFCPDKVPVIGLPFCLAHPRLVQIEKRMMYEVEGGTPKSCMQLLRHECGHAVNYAYQLYKRTRWRELFGHFSTQYSSSYSFQPYSRKYVVHLGDSYAQSHPDEDFAETFAVWLTPDIDWESKYCDWPVISKLRYVDRLMARIGREPPHVTDRQTPYSAARITSTLETFYARKRKYLGREFPGYYDESLRAIFAPASAGNADAIPAAALMRAHRRQITNSVTQWTAQRKFDINHLVTRLITRCKALDLVVHRSEPQTLIEVTALVCSIVNQALRFEGKNT